MQHASLSMSPHPTDARIKCVTTEQIEHLADLHHRPLDLPASSEISSPQAAPDLLSRLSHLEAQVTLLQQQLAGLALELLQERTQRYEQRLHTLEEHIHVPRQQNIAVSPLQPASKPKDKQVKAPHVHPAKGRPRAILPLIEYGADGTYIVVCPQQGELQLIPDSPEWFAWLETISSLRFLGQEGRWSAYRSKGRASCCWFAYRRINGQQYTRALGSPHQLTIARFEQMAATLQSYVTSS
jgi:hypothetical protein